MVMLMAITTRHALPILLSPELNSYPTISDSDTTWEQWWCLWQLQLGMLSQFWVLNQISSRQYNYENSDLMNDGKVSMKQI